MKTVLNEKIVAKETNIRLQLEQLRTKLNEGRVRYNQNSNDWQYFPALVYTEARLKDLLEFFDRKI
jgi:hypothetical protein